MPYSYETLPEEENYLGSGKFGVVERVRQVASNRVSKGFNFHVL
jgi:hypothetical protein